MSAGDRDTLADLLALHQIQDQGSGGTASEAYCVCSCGERNAVRGGRREWAHEKALRHVADVLLASDWLREQRSEAWLKGHLKGMHYTHPEICDDEICPNPYRTTEDTDAH